MAWPLTNTVTLYSISVTNDDGIQKEVEAVVWYYACRLSRLKLNRVDRQRMETSVLDSRMALYTVPSCPITKDQRVAIDGVKYKVLSVHKHSGFSGVDHIYCELSVIS